MKVQKIEKPYYDIYFLKNNKFKTILISTLLLNELDYNNITKDKLISDYLVMSTKKYNNEVLLSRKLMDLYDPRIDIYDIYLGLHIKCFDMHFLNEKYTEKGMNKKTIDFYYDMIFNPNVKDNKFDKSNFNLIKNSLKTNFSIRDENPNELAFYNAMKNIKEDIPIAHDNRGNIKDLNKIDNKNICNYYFGELNNSRLCIFVLGDIDKKKLEEIIDNNLCNKKFIKMIDYKKEYELDNTIINKEIVDKSKFNETIIYIVYKILNMSKRERYIVLPVLNEILGGSSSKLFNNVREKNSLAYYAYSNYSPSQGILYMYAGIDKAKKDKAIKVMESQLKYIIEGDISDDELNGSKNTLINAIELISDNEYKLINDLKLVTLLGRDSYEDKAKLYNSVTKDEIIELAKKLKKYFIYTLEGDNRNEKN